LATKYVDYKKMLLEELATSGSLFSAKNFNLK